MKNNQEQKKERNVSFGQVLRFLIVENWGYKLVALCLGFLLWLALGFAA